MLPVTLVFADGTTDSNFVTRPGRAYPRLLKMAYGGVTAKEFVRRGNELDSTYDETEAEFVTRPGPEPDDAEPWEGHP
jgi:hypothetical protein